MGNRRWLSGMVALALFGIYATRSHGIAEAGQTIYTDQVQSSKSPWKSPFQKIDDRAKLENPADGNSVLALIDEILNYPHTFDLKLPIMYEIVEQRLVQAEINYRLGRTPGVREKTLVQIGNTIADKLKLPEYAQITVHQVEVLRLGMELSMPSFMADANPQVREASVHPNPSDLSPAQAAHILLVLTDQKILNPDYQLTPEEWEKTQYQPAMDRLIKSKELKDSGELAKMRTHAELRAFTLKNDLRGQISQAISDMSLTDGLDLVNEVFGMAGLNK